MMERLRPSHALAGVALAAMAACAPAPPLVVQTPFDGQAGAWIAHRGTAVITGQGFLRQQGGGVVTCAGAEVAALPVTPYSTERMALLYGATERGYNPGRSIPDAPPEYLGQRRHGQCDAQGRFRIAELPAGTYYLITTVRWTVADRPQGGGVMRRVTLRDGETAEVLLTFP